jgi:NitT/TauT family transport system ATP-binding protein
VTALVAGSGRGKTTLLDCIAGLLPPQGGSVTFAPGAGATGAGVAYLFQEPELLPWRTVLQNVALPLEGRCAAPAAEAAAVLALTGLSALADKRPPELSGGEKQRAAMARAAAFPAPVLLLDEAFQSLDLPLKFRLMELLQLLLQRQPRTAVFVTHDVREALCLGDRILVFTGEPLTVRRDLAPGARHPFVADTYVHLPAHLAALEADILGVLGSDGDHESDREREYAQNTQTTTEVTHG